MTHPDPEPQQDVSPLTAEQALPLFVGHHDPRKAILAPFEQLGYVFATNRHWLVCVPLAVGWATLPPVAENDAPHALELFRKHWGDGWPTPPEGFMPLAELALPPMDYCPVCKGKREARWMDCGRCDGHGCHICDGEGGWPDVNGELQPCHHCGGDGVDDSMRMGLELGDNHLALRYLIGLKAIPGCAIDPGVWPGVARFWFPLAEGQHALGFLMPVEKG